MPQVEWEEETHERQRPHNPSVRRRSRVHVGAGAVLGDRESRKTARGAARRSAWRTARRAARRSAREQQESQSPRAQYWCLAATRQRPDRPRGLLLAASHAWGVTHRHTTARRRATATRQIQDSRPRLAYRRDGATDAESGRG